MSTFYQQNPYLLIAYQTLELDDNASILQIKKSYRKLALLYHPDRNKSANAKEKFIVITKAYDFLCDVKNEKTSPNIYPHASNQVAAPEENQREQKLHLLRRKFRSKKDVLTERNGAKVVLSMLFGFFVAPFFAFYIVFTFDISGFLILLLPLVFFVFIPLHLHKILNKKKEKLFNQFLEEMRKL